MGETSVPFVGCPSDGQLGAVEAPSNGTSVSVSPPEVAQKLAFYKSASIGVLALRGWHCFGTYGSGGDSIIATPGEIDTTKIFSRDRINLAGPAISLSLIWGGTSGRFSVADIIARVFPTRTDFVRGVQNEGDMLQSTFTFGPYPADTLAYKSKTVVEYRTAARSEGLGTQFGLSRSDWPIDGVAMLLGTTPDLVLLQVRLGPEHDEITKAIVHQTEREAWRLAP